MAEPMSRLLRINEVAASLGVSRPTIYRMIKQGKFPKPIRIGSSSAWDKAEISEWLQKAKDAR